MIASPLETGPASLGEPPFPGGPIPGEAGFGEEVLPPPPSPEGDVALHGIFRVLEEDRVNKLERLKETAEFYDGLGGTLVEQVFEAEPHAPTKASKPKPVLGHSMPQSLTATPKDPEKQKKVQAAQEAWFRETYDLPDPNAPVEAEEPDDRTPEEKRISEEVDKLFAKPPRTPETNWKGLQKWFGDYQEGSNMPPKPEPETPEHEQATYHPPRNAWQRLKEWRATRVAQKLAPAKTAADNLAKNRQFLTDHINWKGRVRVTKAWVKAHKAEIQAQRKAGQISKAEYDRKMAHLKHFKPHHFLERHLEEGEVYVRPVGKLERKTRARANRLQKKYDSLQKDTKGLKAKIEQKEEALPQQKKRLREQQQRWNAAKKKTRDTAKKATKHIKDAPSRMKAEIEDFRRNRYKGVDDEDDEEVAA